MKKIKVTIEYPLNKASESILWGAIAEPLGLTEWFSDGVTVDGDEYTFSWDQHEQTAHLKQIRQGKLIRFQWEEDKDTDVYFQMEIIMHDITEEVALIITDFAEPAEMDDVIMLWNKQIENLCRKTGMEIK